MYKLKTTLAAINGGADYAVLAGKDNIYAYEDGKRTSDSPIGVKLTLALQGNHLSALTVKFLSDPLPKVTEEEIAEACASCHFLFAQIPDCEVSLYNVKGDKGGIGMSATANTARIVNLKD